MRIPYENLLDQFIKSFLYLRKAPEFIKDNKLWKGYMSHGWMSQVTIVIGVLISYKFFVEVRKLITASSDPEALNETGQFGSNSFYYNHAGNPKYRILACTNE